MKLDECFIEKLQSIPWFSKCGTPSPFEWAVSVTSAKDVIRRITSQKWENMILDTQGSVTEQLSVRSIKGHGRGYQEWNNLVLDFKKRYIPQFKERWEVALASSGLDTTDVLNDISFNILSITVIDAYKAIVPTPSFFLQLLDVYESGYLPCGWKGTANTGKLLIY